MQLSLKLEEYTLKESNKEGRSAGLIRGGGGGGGEWRGTRGTPTAAAVASCKLHSEMYSRLPSRYFSQP